MPVMDEFKEERESLKEQSLRKKLEYFWMYYKWYVIVGALVLVVAVYTIHSIVTSKDEVLNGIAVNSKVMDMEKKEAFLNDFITAQGYKPDKEEAYINTDLSMKSDNSAYNNETDRYIGTYMGAQSLDICILEDDFFHSFAYNCNFLDMATYLDAETLEKLEGHLYYVDLPIAEEYVARLIDHESVEDIEIPDWTKPEEMKDPHPVGIDLSTFPVFMETFGYEEGPVYLGIVKNTKHSEDAVKFIKYLISTLGR